MVYQFKPRGVCSQMMFVDLSDDGVINGLRVLGGCEGNLTGLSRLVQGMRAEDAIDKLKGIQCGGKPTSCPDQLSIALEQALRRQDARG